MEEQADNYWKFLRSKGFRRSIYLYGGLSLVLFIVLRVCYPDPLCMADSNSYVMSAYKLVPNLFRPIGYAWVIHQLAGIASTPYFLISFQCIVGILASFVLWSYLVYTLKLRKPLIVMGLMVVAGCSPSMLLMHRWLLSDSLFCSVLFLNLALWLAMRQNPRAWALYAGYFACGFALMYLRHAGAVVSIALILGGIVLYGKQVWKIAILGIVPIILVMQTTKRANLKTYDMNIYSGFTGFNLINSSSAIFKVKTLGEVRQQLPEGDADMLRVHSVLEKMGQPSFNDYNIINGVLLWRQYSSFSMLADSFRMETPTRSFEAGYFKAGKAYERYAKWLIGKYPGIFLQQFVVPNLGQALVHDSKHAIENPSGFKYQISAFRNTYGIGPKTYTLRYDPYGKVFAPILRGSVLLGLLLAIVSFIAIRKRGEHEKTGNSSLLRKVALGIMLFCIAYLGASVVLSFVEYRYLYFVGILLWTAALLHTQVWLDNKSATAQG